MPPDYGLHAQREYSARGPGRGWRKGNCSKEELKDGLRLKFRDYWSNLLLIYIESILVKV